MPTLREVLKSASTAPDRFFWQKGFTVDEMSSGIPVSGVEKELVDKPIQNSSLAPWCTIIMILGGLLVGVTSLVANPFCVCLELTEKTPDDKQIFQLGWKQNFTCKGLSDTRHTETRNPKIVGSCWLCFVHSYHSFPTWCGMDHGSSAVPLWPSLRCSKSLCGAHQDQPGSRWNSQLLQLLQFYVGSL